MAGRISLGLRSWSQLAGGNRLGRAYLQNGLKLMTPSSTLLCRHLSVHEHFCMEMMSQYGVNVPRGEVAYTPEQAKRVAEKFGGNAVIKAQVLAGGRGKGHFESGLQGGVKLASSADDVEMYAKQMLGQRLITKQTGSIGRVCQKVFVCEKMNLSSEYYFAIVLDRSFMGPAMVASPYGGVNIEEIAETSPNYIYKDGIDITSGLRQEQALTMAKKLGFSDECVDDAVDQMMKLYSLLLDKDVTMLEINPLVEAQDENGKKRVVCMDAKINFDDNAEYRQKSVFDLRDILQEDPRDVEAADAGINYIGLTGSIGCLVNGAGLAMATMDIIDLYGGYPANFLDIGGGASSKEVMAGFRIFNSDPNVNAIFVNIFGGIIKCDEIAKGIIAARQESNIPLPIVVRLQGNNQKKANLLIEASELGMIAVDDFDCAAETVVAVSKIAKLAQDVSIKVDFSPLT